MFILCVQQVVTEAFKKQGGKDEVCFPILICFLNVLVFLSFQYSVLFCFTYFTHIHMYVDLIYFTCIQYCVCTYALYMCVQGVITDEIVQQQLTPNGVSLCIFIRNCISVYVSSRIVCCCCLCLLTHLYVHCGQTCTYISLCLHVYHSTTSKRGGVNIRRRCSIRIWM